MVKFTVDHLSAAGTSSLPVSMLHVNRLSCVGVQIENHQRLSWNAESKIGSLEKAHHKPAGGDVKVSC